MWLIGARAAISAHAAERADLLIRGSRLHFAARPAESSDPVVDLTGCLLLPGLINAHDHLEFSLFPQLGRRLYGNAHEWAADVYRPAESPVAEHRAVPRAVRLIWGGIRNLLSGVTTVLHHNPSNEVFSSNFPVRVVRRFDWAHSLAFAPDLAKLFQGREKGRPFIVHAAEGTDVRARREIRRLNEMGVLCDETVLVHAIGLAPGDLDILLRRGCSVVFCPNSNLATYGQTLSAETLRSGIRAALGTDSAISCEGDLRDDIRIARRAGLSDDEVYRMATSAAADILRLRDGEGLIRDGGVADLVAVRDTGKSPASAIFELVPELVMVGGRIKLISERLAAGCLAPIIRCFQRICLESVGGGLIDADVGLLRHEAESRIGSRCRLAGRLVSS